ncbi:MAG: histidinol phosphate phosphatase domain-containing protein [Smithellaceae bacterium]|nr:histidinol phosphate phosphatase domain-containing protein [Smithellaceae bacterium]
MIDLHTHSIFSDGELIPTELARRAQVKGYRVLAITDHGDHSNVEFIIPRIVKVGKAISEKHGITVIPGIELTHVHPDSIAALADEARALGARLIVVHGETIVEPVLPGTNLAALKADIDILAHPGLISDDEVSLAAERGIALEITTRRGHSLTNGHVFRLAKLYEASVVINNDAHAPEDLIDYEMAMRIVLGAGAAAADFEQMRRNAANIAKRVMA